MTTPFYQSTEWKTARRAALERARYRCAFCGANIAARGAARVDHVTPIKVDPARALDPTNLRALCVRCDAARHAEKGNRNVPRAAIGLDGFPLE
jgi:5-methylcytosine-specific restriction endonuclease McrA